MLVSPLPGSALLMPGLASGLRLSVTTKHGWSCIGVVVGCYLPVGGSLICTSRLRLLSPVNTQQSSQHVLRSRALVLPGCLVG